MRAPPSCALQMLDRCSWLRSSYIPVPSVTTVTIEQPPVFHGALPISYASVTHRHGYHISYSISLTAGCLLHDLSQALLVARVRSRMRPAGDFATSASTSPQTLLLLRATIRNC